MGLNEKVIKKITEYGITIFNDYPIPNEEEHVYYIEDMILFVNEKDNYIGVSFQAITRPERVANLTLILAELKCKKLQVMESFIFNEKNEIVCGESAFKLIKKSDYMKALHEASEQQQYMNFLQTAKCHEC